MKKLLMLVAIGCVWWMLDSPMFAQNVVTVSSCPKRPTLPVTFEVDCSHVADPATRQLCRPFAENQACKVFWAYRNITGIRLEEDCPTLKYTIYDKDKFPHRQGEGGVALRCAADYVADYSVLIKSEIGPYDVHEILHVYQDRLGALPDAHILFEASMTEARREIGDEKGYEVAMSRLKSGLQYTETGFAKGTIPAEKGCLVAEFYIESSLYLKNPKNVELFYRKLEISRKKDMADRQARFNRMYDAVSGGTVKQYLLAHCPPF
jgi:hypothetical protein